MLSEIIIAFVSGVFTKLTDLVIDDGKKILFKHSDLLFGIIYGILVGYLISVSSIIAPLWIGVVFGVILAGKIDGVGHVVGVIFIIGTVAILGLSDINWWFVFLFTIVNVIEEKLNDRADKWRPTRVAKLIRMRPFAEITALIVSIATGEYLLIFAILFFDFGYLSITQYGKRI